MVDKTVSKISDSCVEVNTSGRQDVWNQRLRQLKLDGGHKETDT